MRKGRDLMQYISFYDHDDNKHENRAFSPAGRDITAYIAFAIGRLGYSVEIVSPILTKNNTGIYRGKRYSINDSVSVVLPPSFGVKTLLGKCLRRLWQKCVLYFFVIHKVKRNSIVVVYHSVSLLKVIVLLKRIKRCKVILQVEEVYGDVNNDSELRCREMQIFKEADAFLFPTEALSREINLDHKLYAIVHGNYNAIPLKKEKFQDGKIHCVYAGTFDMVKGGAINTIAASEFLDEKYVIHILGFGSESEIDRVKNAISSVEQQIYCHIQYEGLKTGDDFISFIQKCDIGLSTQNPDGKYNATSFPSKVLMYLSNGLKVVSTDISVLRDSNVAECIFYAKSASGKDIAEAISNAAHDNSSISSERLLERLDSDFLKQMNGIIGGLQNEI